MPADSTSVIGSYLQMQTAAQQSVYVAVSTHQLIPDSLAAAAAIATTMNFTHTLQIHQ